MTSPNAAALAARLAELPAALVHATPQAVRASGDVLATHVRANIVQTTGGDARLSRVRSGRGASIGTDVDIVGAGSRTQARVTPTGPIMLVEEDTAPHREPFTYGTGRRYAMAGESMAGVANSGGNIIRRSRRGRAGRRGFLFIPGVGYRMTASHPGTRGKHPVRNAFREAGDDAGRAGALVFQRTIRQTLR